MASGIVGSVVGNLVSNVAGSLLSQFSSQMLSGAIGNLISGAVGQSIKNVIDQLPLPGFIQRAANEMVDNIFNNARQAVDPAAQDAVNNTYGEIAQGFQDTFTDMLMGLVRRNVEEEAKKGGNEGEGANWLVALAKAMSQVQVEHLNKALEASDTMAKNTGEGEKARTNFINAQSEFQAHMKLFSMASEAAANAIKSVGDGLSSLARKQ